MIKGLDPILFASGQIGSKIRNILISSALYKYGYIDAFGTGFDRTFTLCAQTGVEYKYREDEFGFTFIFERNVNFLNDKINGKIKVDEFDEILIKQLKRNKYFTIPQLADVTGKSNATIHRYLSRMMDSGILERIGSRKTGYWKIK